MFLPAGDTVSAALGRAARKFRDRPALFFRERVWTFAELDSAASNVACALLGAGLNPGDRVAAYGRNSDAYLLAWLGCCRAGLVHVPVNFGLSGDELTYVIEQSGARAALCDTERLVALFELPAGRRLHLIGSLVGDRAFDVLTLAAEGDGAPPDMVVDGGDLAQIQYTSGTTSAPKGAMMTQRAVISEYASCIHDLNYAEGDRCLAALPLYHTAQMHAFTMPQLLAGATTWLIDAPVPRTVLRLIEEHRITSFFAPPTVWISLLRDPAFDQHDLTSLTKLYYGASIMPGPVLAEIRERLPDAGPYNVYGQSEIGPVATVLTPAEHFERPTSAGRPVLHVETRVVDSDMRDVAPGERGEIVHRSPQLLVGYWEKPEETKAAFEGGWFHSGDVGVIDEAGYIFVVDRVRDVINTGGVLVAGREVEDALFTHRSVQEVAVIGLPHPKWIEAITAVVVLRSGESVEADELIAHARETLAGFKVPKHVLFVEDLPRNASGKVLKRELRTLFSAAAGGDAV
ncbi:fatty acyl-CoA synthetase [Sphingopyxis sp. MSC1_008]|uniref:fatty acyl-CoA synthetase n=1 Tax=Sphingopyxis sp. MSC1_008 TaxID=2909265 RepID=UPI0020BF9899|nr:fatty acyl-CoA synthetase [Sphingopyxis sp. MSC1_008]